MLTKLVKHFVVDIFRLADSLNSETNSMHLRHGNDSSHVKFAYDITMVDEDAHAGVFKTAERWEQ